MERRTRYSTAVLVAAIATVFVVFGHRPMAGSPLREPIGDGETVEVLPFAANDPLTREVGSLRRTLAQDPARVAAAIRLAELHIRLARERSDPRHLGHAQAVLAPWWDDGDAPIRVLVLRATIEQSLHQFDDALAVLDRALERAPATTQAWLTRATILTVLGRYDEARVSCSQVGAYGAALAAAVCDAQIDSLTGHAKRAIERLDDLLTSRRALPASEEQWARSSMAEFAARAGDAPRADALFRRALELDARDGYARGAYTDFLVDHGRYADAMALLEGQEANDGLLLRLAIAESRVKSRAAAAHVDALTARFDASRERGDTVHRREEARFWLELRGDPRRALALATLNWGVQKEPWDARVLLEAALAAEARGDASPVIAFVRRTGLEDPAVTRALDRLTADDDRRAETR